MDGPKVQENAERRSVAACAETSTVNLAQPNSRGAMAAALGLDPVACDTAMSKWKARVAAPVDPQDTTESEVDGAVDDPKQLPAAGRRVLLVGGGPLACATAVWLAVTSPPSSPGTLYPPPHAVNLWL